MTCIRCNHAPAKRFGYYGRRCVQRYRCNSCSATFAVPAPKFGTHYTDHAKAAQALSMMLEGVSVRAISRLTGLHKDTILSLMVTAAGRAASALAGVRNVPVRYVQADEMWCFVGKKQKHVRAGDSPDLGDQWIFVAMDADTMLLAAYAIGKRTRGTTHEFLTNLDRSIAGGRFQLTTDGFHFYERGVEDVFAGRADFAQLVKLYGDYGQHGSERYSPGHITEVISKVRDGRPDPAHISTSYVERANLSLRKCCAPASPKSQPNNQLGWPPLDVAWDKVLAPPKWRPASVSDRLAYRYPLAFEFLRECRNFQRRMGILLSKGVIARADMGPGWGVGLDGRLVSCLLAHHPKVIDARAGGGGE